MHRKAAGGQSLVTGVELPLGMLQFENVSVDERNMVMVWREDRPAVSFAGRLKKCHQADDPRPGESRGFFKMAEPLIVRLTKRQTETAAENLKALLEEDAL
jgi:hypothetical protein